MTRFPFFPVASIPIVVLGLLASGSCGEQSLGPRHVLRTIAVGDTVSGRLSTAGGEVQFAFPGEADSIYAVFLQTVNGSLLLKASDTARGLVLGQVLATPGHQLLERATLPFGFGAAPVLLVVSGADSGGFRLFVYRVHQAPETRPSRFVLGDTVQESLETLADIDTFVVAGTAGQELIAYIQATDSAAPGIVSLGVESLAGAGSVAGDSDLQQEATDRFILSATRDYRVTLQAANDFLTGIRSFHGNYRFQVRAVQRSPESVPGAVQPGDTVTGESIDYVGDIDDFTLTGTAGQEVNVFFQALSGSGLTRLELDVLDATGQVVTGVQSGGADAELLGQAVGRIALPGAGTYRLQVFGVDARSPAGRGPYRFWIYPVDRHPEIAADTVAYRDSILTEAIDVPGDIDEFHVSVPESTLANLVVENDAVDGSVSVEIEDSTGTSMYSATAFMPGAAGQSGAFLLTPGNYLLRVEGSFGAASQYRGPYGLRLYAGFTSKPESLSDTVGVGDTITGEAISPPGDYDDFWFLGTRGEHVNLALEGQAAPSAGGFGATLNGPSPTFQYLGGVSSPTQADSLGTHETGRIDIPVDGWYRVTVGGGSSPPQLFEAGLYRFALTLRSTAPESAAALLIPGDSVTNESIDLQDDWDEFTLTGTPGQLLTIVARTVDPAPMGFPLIAVFDSVTTDTVAWTAAQGFDKPSEYFMMPASGRLKIAVYHPAVGFGGDFLGGYRFAVVPVNPAPENAPATFALGDTVRGEAVFPAMDVDDFTSTATPGDTLVPSYRLLADPVPSGKLITLEVVDPATGTVLVGTGVSVVAAMPEFLSPGLFVVPPQGSYVIRVRGGGSAGDQLGTAPYEFFVRPGP